MPSITNVLISLASLAPLVTAVGNAVVVNNCAYPVYLWSVGGSIGPEQTIQPGTHYEEAFHRDPASGGVALKITKTVNGLYDGSPQTIYAYTLDNNGVYYDLSDVFGDAFAGSALVTKPVDASCREICWDAGVPPGGSQVKVCGASEDIALTLCAQSC